MSQLEQVARLIALIQSRHELVCARSLLAPHHAWRAKIVASCPESVPVTAPAESSFGLALIAKNPRHGVC
jgi:hypothetical protein